MRVKRYIVDAMPDAMLKIRSELGADAVILSTKEMKVGGIFGLFGKKKIEVIAATEGNEAPSPKAKTARPTPVAPAPVARGPFPRRIVKLRSSDRRRQVRLCHPRQPRASRPSHCKSGRNRRSSEPPFQPLPSGRRSPRRRRLPPMPGLPRTCRITAHSLPG